MLNYKSSISVVLSLVSLSAQAAPLCDPNAKPSIKIDVGPVYSTKEQIQQAKDLAKKQKVAKDANTTLEYSIEGNFFFEKTTTKSQAEQASPQINGSFPPNIALPVNPGNTSITSASQVTRGNYKSVLSPQIVQLLDSIMNNMKNGFTIPQGQVVTVSSSADIDVATKDVKKAGAGYVQAQVDSSYVGGKVDNSTLSLKRAQNLITIIQGVTGLKAQFVPKAILGSNTRDKASDRYVKVEGLKWVKSLSDASCVKHEMKPPKINMGDCNKDFANVNGFKGDSRGGPAGKEENYLVPGDPKMGDSLNVTKNLDFGEASGTVLFRFNPYSVPDRLVVEYGGKVYDTGYFGDMAKGASVSEAGDLKARLKEVKKKGEIDKVDKKGAREAADLLDNDSPKDRFEGYQMALKLFGINSPLGYQPQGGPIKITLDPKLGGKMKAYVYGPLGTTKWALRTQCEAPK